MKLDTFDVRAEVLIKATLIAESAINKSSLDEVHKNALLDMARQTREWAFNPGTEFRNLKSLFYLEKDFFTFWNESSDASVELFWKEIKSAGLAFKRKDILSEIFKRKKIKNIHEFNYVIDSLVIAQQEGRITLEQATILNTYLGDFEQKSKRR